jgi:hypothetical protein
MPERHDHPVPVTFTRTPRSTAELVPHQPDDVKTWLKEITLNDAIVHLYTKKYQDVPQICASVETFGEHLEIANPVAYIDPAIPADCQSERNHGRCCELRCAIPALRGA